MGCFCGSLRKRKKKTYPVLPVLFQFCYFFLKPECCVHVCVCVHACVWWLWGGWDVLFEAQFESQISVRTALSPPNQDLHHTASLPPLPHSPNKPSPMHTSHCLWFISSDQKRGRRMKRERYIRNATTMTITTNQQLMLPPILGRKAPPGVELENIIPYYYRCKSP